MQWQEIRQHFPNQWVLLEAVKAHSEANHWIVEDMAALEAFSDSEAMLRTYLKLHQAEPERDIFYFHTSQEQIDIVEDTWLGLRG